MFEKLHKQGKLLIICRCFCSARYKPGGLSSGSQPAVFNIRMSGAGTSMYKIRYPPVIRDPQLLRVMVGDVDIPRSVLSVLTCWLMVSFQPVGVEYGAEITYPALHSVSNGLINNGFTYAWSSLLTLIGGLLIKYEMS